MTHHAVPAVSVELVPAEPRGSCRQLVACELLSSSNPNNAYTPGPQQLFLLSDVDRIARLDIDLLIARPSHSLFLPCETLIEKQY